MVNLIQDIKPISYVKAHTADVMKQIEEKNNPMVITQNGEAKAVLMAVKQYQNIIDTINLLKILSIGENDIKNNRFYTHEQVQAKIKSTLDQLMDIIWSKDAGDELFEIISFIKQNRMEILSIIDQRRNLEEILYQKIIEGKIV